MANNYYGNRAWDIKRKIFIFGCVQLGIGICHEFDLLSFAFFVGDGGDRDRYRIFERR
ncbi:MAG: hypothetical protein RMX98_023590 [Nostoc sp. DedQUE02]|nr:hypothetical protein [Nostoc sp. DedQUE02]